MSANELSRRVAEEIRVQLARRNISAAELARRTGLKQPYLSRRMTCEVSFDLADLDKISRTLGVTIHDLLPAPSEARESPRGRDITQSLSMPTRSHSVAKAVTCPRPSGRSASKGASRSTRRPVILPAHAADTTQ